MIPNYYSPYMNPVSMAQQPQRNDTFAWVQGENAAKSYLVAPNSSVFLMDSEKNTFYIKSADASGMPLPLRVFDYVERTQTPTPAPAAALDNYITREEFEKRIAELNPPKGKKVKEDE